MDSGRFKFLCCVPLVVWFIAASAQQIRKPALGNEVLAKQRSARFLAERGVASSGPRPRYSRSPAQMLAQARAQYRNQSQISAASAPQTPIWQPVGPAQVTTAAYGEVTGPITSIAADSSDATGNTVYVGTAYGGVWKSTNAAGSPASVTFVPLTDAVYSSLSQTASVAVAQYWSHKRAARRFRRHPRTAGRDG